MAGPTLGMAAMTAALAVLVGVVAYDPTPIRVIVVAVCSTLAGFTLGQRTGGWRTARSKKGKAAAE